MNLVNRNVCDIPWIFYENMKIINEEVVNFAVCFHIYVGEYFGNNFESILCFWNVVLFCFWVWRGIIYGSKELFK